MVALNVEGTRLTLVGIQRAARDSLDLLVVDRHDAIVDDRHNAAHQRDVERLPLSRRARQFGLGRDPSVNRPDAALRRIAGERFIFDLNFITAPQVEAAVAVVGAVHFVVHLEILERTRRFQVCAVSGVHQQPVLNLPVAGVRTDRFPTRKVFAVEERLGIRPCCRGAAL